MGGSVIANDAGELRLPATCGHPDEVQYTTLSLLDDIAREVGDTQVMDKGHKSLRHQFCRLIDTEGSFNSGTN